MSDVLVGSGTAGDFVKETQGVATEQGFNHVSKAWYPKTLSYAEGMEVLQAQHDEREDIVCTLQTMAPSFDSKGIIFRNVDGREFRPDEWALTQYASRVYTPGTVVKDLTSNRTRPSGSTIFERDESDFGLLVDYFNNGVRRVEPAKKFRFRTYKNGTVRAVLTEDYSPVDNRWYLELLSELIPGGRLSHWRGDADTIYGNILIPDTIRESYDGEYGGMLSISNCEIGKRVIGQFPSLFRAICMNGCIWSQTKGDAIRKPHRGIVLDNLKNDIVTNVMKQIPLAHAGIDALLATRADDYGIGSTNMAKVVAEITSDLKMTPAESVAVFEQWNRHENTDRNLFGLIAGITRAGQLPKFDNKTWVDFDIIAGNLLTVTSADWKKAVRRAGDMDDETFNKVYGIDKKTVAV